METGAMEMEMGAVGREDGELERVDARENLEHSTGTPTSSSSRQSTAPSSPPALFPIESEEVGQGHKGSESIRPDHYWEPSHGCAGIPVFKPTMDEFREFDVFMQNVDHYGAQAGVIKVIPPQEWRDALPDVRPRVAGCKVKNAVIQHIMGTRGSYAITNVVTSKLYQPGDWWKACEAKKTPGLKKVEIGEAVEGGTGESPSKRVKVEDVPTVTLADLAMAEQADASEGQSKSDSSDTKERSAVPADDSSIASLDAVASSSMPDPVDDSTPKPALFDPLSTPPDELAAYTREFCHELERHYWRNLTFGQAMYGADVKGSLFTDETTSWNVANLPNMLSRVKQKIPGVNTPYLYWGMWKASFPWHLEDMDLYSINYIHFGAPKQWYVIPPAEADRFKNVMSGLFPSDAQACPEFLRHKSFLASPHILHSAGITVQKVVQYEGEFIITFPFGYHSGYNLGYNCAESLNFALERWLDIGRKAGACDCVDHSVRINVDELFSPENLKPEFGGIEKKKKKATAAATTTRREDGAGPSTMPTKSRPCVLCPSTMELDLVETDHGEMAHRVCALSIPGPFLVRDPTTNLERVHGTEWIDKARRDLKCAICGIKGQGACIQCCKAKCSASFHASCAVWGADGRGHDRKNEVSGVSLEMREFVAAAETERPASEEQVNMEPSSTCEASTTVVPTQATLTPTTTYSSALCRRHNPAYAELKRLAKIQALKETIGSLQEGSRVVVRSAGGLFGGTVLAVSEQAQTATVQFDQGSVAETAWGRISMAKEGDEIVDRQKPVLSDFVYEGPARTFRAPTHGAGTRAASGVGEGFSLGKRPLRPW